MGANQEGKENIHEAPEWDWKAGTLSLEVGEAESWTFREHVEPRSLGHSQILITADVSEH